MRKILGNRIALEGIVEQSENGLKKISNSALKIGRKEKTEMSEKEMGGDS